jgi:hypothetical protein
LRIVSITPTPGSNRYAIVCPNGHPFETTGDNRGRVKCPTCKREASLHNLLEDYQATPAESFKKLRAIAKEAREIYEKWLSIPELKRDRGEGKILADKFNELCSKAKILSSKIPSKVKVTS